MAKKYVLERYLDVLLKGDRSACRSVIEETLQSGVPANQVYMEVIWPIMVEIDRLYREDRIDSAQEAFATRINRTIVDQLQNKLPRKAQQSKKIVICSNTTEQAELGGQMIADLFESDGWETRLLGGSVNNDDILSFVNSYHPDILLLYGTEPKGAPGVRQLVDTIKEVNACPEMRVMLSGGIFDRAEGLWVEMDADLFATTAIEALQAASNDSQSEPYEPRKTNRRKKRGQKMAKDLPVQTT